MPLRPPPVASGREAERPVASGRGAERRVASGRAAELFLYPGEGHLFEDRSQPSYDAEAAALLSRRVLGLLDRTD